MGKINTKKSRKNQLELPLKNNHGEHQWIFDLLDKYEEENSKKDQKEFSVLSTN